VKYDSGFDNFDPLVQKYPSSHAPDGALILYNPQYDPGGQSKHSVTFCLPLDGLYVPGGHGDGYGEAVGQYDPIGHV
jgi:hypothetical protein